MNITTDFNIDDEIKIKALNLKGRVIAVRVNTFGLEIYVKYYSNNDMKYDYFFEDELEHVKDEVPSFALGIV